MNISRITKFALAGVSALVISTTAHAQMDDAAAAADEAATEAAEAAQGAGDAVGDAAGDMGDAAADAVDTATPDVETPEAPTAPAMETGGKWSDGNAAPSMITLGKGRLSIGVAVEASLNENAVFDPLTIAPDIYYGVTDELQIGLVHSSWARNGFVQPGNSLCIGDACGDAYNGLALDVVYGFLNNGDMELGAHLQIGFGPLDPLFLDVRAGVKGHWTSGKIGVMFDPYVTFGITETDASNRAGLGIPVGVGYMASEQLMPFLYTGFYGAFEEFGDSWIIPLGIGAMYHVNANLGLGGGFQFVPLTAADGDGAFDNRSLSLWVKYNM